MYLAREIKVYYIYYFTFRKNLDKNKRENEVDISRTEKKRIKKSYQGLKLVSKRNIIIKCIQPNT